MRLDPADSKPHTITVRLDSNMHKKLRQFSFATNQKKQPLIRFALLEFFTKLDKLSDRKRLEVIDRLAVAPRLKHPLKPERVTLEKELSEKLQRIKQEFGMKYQQITCAALEEYMTIMERNVPEVKLFIDAYEGRQRFYEKQRKKTKKRSA